MTIMVSSSGGDTMKQLIQFWNHYQEFLTKEIAEDLSYYN